MYMHITKQTQSNGQTNLTRSRIAALHDHSIVFATWRQCVPSIQNMVRSLSTKLVDGRDSGVETWGSCGSMNRGPELLEAGPGWCHKNYGQESNRPSSKPHPRSQHFGLPASALGTAAAEEGPQVTAEPGPLIERLARPLGRALVDHTYDGRRVVVGRMHTVYYTSVDCKPPTR